MEEKVIELIGRLESQFKTNKLPTNKEVLSVVCYLHLKEGKTIKHSNDTVAQMLLTIWQEKGIVTREKCHVINQISKLYNTVQSLNKHKDRKSKTHLAQVRDFKSHLYDLCDIAHANALNIIDIEKKKVLQNARKSTGRPSEYYDKPSGKRQKAIKRKKSKLEKQELFVEEDSESDLYENKEDSDISDAEKELSKHLRKKLKTNNNKPNENFSIDNQKVLSIFDRSLISVRSRSMIMHTAKQLSGHSFKGTSKSSIHRKSVMVRNNISKETENDILSFNAYTVHWDGKMMLDLKKVEKIDRLPIVVTDKSSEKILYIHNNNDSSGATMAASIFKSLCDYKFEKKIVAMCYDTTKSNTGSKKGARIQLEQLLGRELLNLSCRKHISELLLESEFSGHHKECQIGPDITFFKAFRNDWQKIDQNNFKSAETDAYVMKLVSPKMNEIEEFIQQVLNLEKQPRDDYKEFLQLCLVVMGKKKIYNFLKPGALHRARWMARAIYTLKMYLFRDQIKLTKEEKKATQNLVIFIINIYVKYWFQTSLTIAAPLNDLNLLKDLKALKDLNISKIGSFALRKMALQTDNHLDYLSPELVCFSLLDKRVDLQIKCSMASKLRDYYNIGENSALNKKAPAKRLLTASVNLENNFDKVDLSHFITQQSCNFFKILNVNPTFININDPNEWHTNNDFVTLKEIVMNLRVVNDTAERAVSLAQQFNGKLTKDEEQYQCIVKTVTNNRRILTADSKSLKNYLEK